MKYIKSLFLMMIVFGIFPLSGKQTAKKTNVAPVQPVPISVIPRPVIQPEQKELYHLVPTDATTLQQYDLCPLFGPGGGHYLIFNPASRTSSGELVARFEAEHVYQNAPCIVALGQFNNWHRTLMQLKSLDQGELSAKTGLAQALCAGHSLNNGRLMRDYALTGNMQDLRKLHNFNDSAHFLLEHKFGEWLYVEDVKKSIAQLRNLLGVDGIDVSAVSTVSLFDSNLDKKPGFEIFNQQEFDYVQQVKANIRKGLQQDNYVHVMIIGNEELIEGGRGHYFCFVIIKAGNNIQYIVLDTSSVSYHLQQGSHSMDRLMFVIQNIELGYSLIHMVNIRIMRYLENIEQVRQQQARQRAKEEQARQQRARGEKARPVEERKAQAYITLGIDNNADEAAIKKAYRTLALKWHPDKWAGASAAEQENAKRVFQDIQNAYEILTK